MDRADLFLFATFSSEVSQLLLFKSQPTETLIQVDSLPIAPGVHHLDVNAPR